MSAVEQPGERRLSEFANVDRQDTLVELVVQPGVEGADEELAGRLALPDSYAVPATRLVRLDDCLIETRMGVAFTRDDRYVPDTLRNARQAEGNGYEPLGDGQYRIQAEAAGEISGEAMLVGLPCGGNYFHWLVEAVGRAVVARESISAATTLLVQPLRDMEREALEMAQLPLENVRELPADGVVAVESLLVPPRGLNGPHRLVPETMHSLHALGSPASGERCRVFVSRSRARRRRIENEPELQDLLSGYGFVTVAAESLSVAEQVLLFAEAEAIISNHGGGLANAVFSSPGSLLIELQPPQLGDVRIMLFWNLAATRALRYVQMVCRAGRSQTEVPAPQRDIEVDCAHLDQLLGRHLSRP